MNQFFYTLSFCLKHFSYLFVLALPLITLEFAVSYLVVLTSLFFYKAFNDRNKISLFLSSVLLAVYFLNPIHHNNENMSDENLTFPSEQSASILCIVATAIWNVYNTTATCCDNFSRNQINLAKLYQCY